MTTRYFTILLVIFAVAFFALLPTNTYMTRLEWGYYPSVIIALIVAALAYQVVRGTAGRRLH